MSDPLTGPISYEDYVARVSDLYGKARGKRLAGENFPVCVRSIPTPHHL